VEGGTSAGRLGGRWDLGRAVGWKIFFLVGKPGFFVLFPSWWCLGWFLLRRWGWWPPPPSETSHLLLPSPAGDQIVGATVYFDNLASGEVAQLLDSMGHHTVGLRLQRRGDKSPLPGQSWAHEALVAGGPEVVLVSDGDGGARGMG